MSVKDLKKLEEEIAKETNPEVRERLQALLDKRVKQRSAIIHFENWAVLCAVALTIVVIVLFVYFRQR